MGAKKVLITGVTGFIGWAIAKGLVGGGWQVRGLSRTLPEEIPPKSINYIKGDIRKPEDVERAAEGCEIIINTATLYQSGANSSEDLKSTNAEGPVNVIKAAIKCGILKVVHLSTCGIFSRNTTFPLCEDSAVDPESRDIYERSKCLGEEAIIRCAEKSDITLVVLRPTTVYGRGDERLLKLFQLISKRRFFYIGGGDNLLQPLFITDLVECVKRVLDVTCKSSLYLIAGPQTVSLKEWVEIISYYLNVKPPGLHIPAFPVAMMTGLLEMVSNKIGVSSPIYKGRLDFFLRSMTCNTSLIRKEVGWQPCIDIREGTYKTIESYKEAKLI
ncbi:MAG: NAD-dependent epimerase/dehydratase family protein [Candidatus Scalinduaceae bacterium]